MRHISRRTAQAGLAATLLIGAAPLASTLIVLPGANALAGHPPKVSAELRVPVPEGTLPYALTLDLVITRLGGGKPVTRYDVELTKRLHLIAVSGDFLSFLHEHAIAPSPDGHFRVAMQFPRAGLWHVYADATPEGLGQQVMRFALPLDPAGAASPQIVVPQAAPHPTGTEGRDGRYTVRFDQFGLRAGQETQLALQIFRDGQRAPDLTPFLGVAAHAVFIDTADLTYVHAHAAPALPGMKGMPGMEMSAMHGAALREGQKIAPHLLLHVRPPRAGTYALWVQFMAGGEVRTVPFVVQVT